MSDIVWRRLRDAVYARDFLEAEKLLTESPELPNLRNSIGETVLHFLAVENDIEGVSWLHARGFSLNEKNKFGIPTVFEVAQLEYKELFLWFQHHGADLSAKDADGNDLRTNLIEYGKEEMAQFVETALGPH
jgi:ankyrin repeat protein